MYICVALMFLAGCCSFLYLYMQIKEREDEIEELYDMYEGLGTALRNIQGSKEKEKKKKKSKVIDYDFS